MPFGIQVKNTILSLFLSSRLKAAPTVHRMRFANLVVSVSFAQAVPKFQLDCKKINLLSDRASKSTLGEKWWRSEMVEAGRFPTSMSIGLPGRLFIPIPRSTKVLNEAFRRVAVSPRHRVVPPTVSLRGWFDHNSLGQRKLWQPIVDPGNSCKNEG